MIRFNCPHCQREYQLPSALAGLPLVCKGCGQRFVPAALPPAPEPPAPPPAPKVERPVLPPAPAPKIEAPPKVADTNGDVLVSKADSTPDIDFNVGGPTAASISDANRQRPKGLSGAEVALPATGADTERDAASVPELDLEGLAKAKAQSRGRLELPVPKPARSEPPPKQNREPRRVPPAPQPAPPPDPAARSGLIPFAADLFALVALLVGGMLVGEVLVKKHTGAVLADASETPLDALVWAAVPLTLALVYLLLAGRGRSLGARVRGR